MNKPVTIATFSFLHQAAIVQGMIESQGIECFLKDVNTIIANPFYANAIGGVKVQVNDTDEVRAKEIVAEYYTNTNSVSASNPAEEIPLEDKTTATQSTITCPICGSTDVYKDKTPSGPVLLFVYLTAIPLFLMGKKKYHCFNCGSDFKVK